MLWKSFAAVGVEQGFEAMASPTAKVIETLLFFILTRPKKRPSGIFPQIQ
jgi:hypothetical protein